MLIGQDVSLSQEEAENSTHQPHIELKEQEKGRTAELTSIGTIQIKLTNYT
jgi:hypothetical protein